MISGSIAVRPTRFPAVARGGAGANVANEQENAAMFQKEVTGSDVSCPATPHEHMLPLILNFIQPEIT